MKAEEIRKGARDVMQATGDTAKDAPVELLAANTLGVQLTLFLSEIAAQLAELNQHLRDLHPELNLPEECRQHKCDYYTAYQAYGNREDDMSHEAYHEQVRAGSEHFKNCHHDGPDTCKVCEGYEKRLRA